MFRPQYAYPPTPPGFDDEVFHYSFDATNTPLLGIALGSGAQANDIILPMEQDAPFICRGIKILGTNGERGGIASSTLNFRLKTPHGDYLQTSPVPIALYAEGGGLGIAGKMVVAFEPEVICPRGSVWTLYLYNPTLGSVTPPALTLFGVKRRECGKRRAA